MPTYQNRGSEKITIGTTTFSPGARVELPYYVNIAFCEDLVKISDNPPISHPFVLVFENQNGLSNMSKMYSFYTTNILKIEDGSSPAAVDVEVDITIFAGVTDFVENLMPVETLTYKRKTYRDQEGNSVAYWQPLNGYKCKQQLIDAIHEIVAFQVTRASGSGNFNVLIKPFA